ncbi:MAG: hypothetical protein K0Q73_7507, partial [Paenibacillus sp.]|nr:hypothetical protein [Paenibacillus sp.]
VDALKEAIAETESAIDLMGLQDKAAELKITDFEKLNRDELIAAIEAAGGGSVAQ